MALLTPANFREQTLAAACAGLKLDQSEAPDTDLTTWIAAVTQRVNEVCGDFFEPSTTSLEHDVAWDSSRLYLQRRTTAVTAVKTRDALGNLTTQSSTAYRLHSSLDSTGAVKLEGSDYLELIWGGGGLASTWNPWLWPTGTQTVQVTGTFGWTTAPGDVKRAVAMMVWDVFKRQDSDVRRAIRWARGDLTVERDTDTMTGMREADELLKPYLRGGSTGDPLVLIA